MHRTRARLENYLRQGKTLSACVEFTDETGEPGTTMVSLWMTESKTFRVNIETYLNKHALVEQLYKRDEIRDFASLSVAVAFVERETGIKLEQMNA